MTERMLSTMSPEGDRVLVRVQDVYDTTVEDLWSAVTEPARLARWIAEVSGDLRVGGTFTARFTSSWEGTGEVLECAPPHRLRVSTREEGAEPNEIEVVITADGDGARLVVEEHGFLPEAAPAHAAGWQVHLEDLGAALADGPSSDWATRWRELIPAYRSGA
ncbi:SRPBCC family protein [uncultured Amnibacterium sp.]|uniref:SRPBCC family protein n=1 Tax=uncultured Amnibacterium sp. TaxID=1631851 RepID=UPI0035CB9A91